MFRVLFLFFSTNQKFNDYRTITVLQVEPNVKKIEEHRRKYERLRKEKELKKVEQDRQRRQAAQVLILSLNF